MSHFKAKMHQIRFLVCVLSVFLLDGVWHCGSVAIILNDNRLSKLSQLLFVKIFCIFETIEPGSVWIETMKIACSASDWGRRCINIVILPSIPQWTDELRRRNAIRVMRNQSQQQRSILSQIVAGKLARQLSITQSQRRLHSVSHLQVILNEAHTISKRHSTTQPQQQTQTTSHRNKHHPEPEEHVDLLIVGVDRKHTLHCVWLHIAEILTADFHVTQSDSRECHITLVFRPIATQRLSIGNIPITYSNHVSFYSLALLRLSFQTCGFPEILKTNFKMWFCFYVLLMYKTAVYTLVNGDITHQKPQI